MTLILRAQSKAPDSVSASILLAEAGLSLLRAKRIIERVMARGQAVAELPSVADTDRLVERLQGAGFRISLPRVPTTHSIAQTLRRVRERLDLTQQEFAVRYGFTIDALQNWEQERRPPAPWLFAYLHMIEKDPRAAAEVLEEKL